jgi:glutaredoxin-related protein
MLGDERYLAINTRNINTIEFRMFNSNTRPERIIKNAQVIFSLIDFTKTKIKVSMKNYLRFIEDHRKDYKELYDFLIEKHIYIPKLSLERLLELSAEDNNEVQKYIQSLSATQNLTVDESDNEGDIQCA